MIASVIALEDIRAGETVASNNTGEQGICALATENIPVGTPIELDGQGRARAMPEAGTA